MFAEDREEDMRQIEKCILTKDFTTLKFSAHHLKGTLGNFMDPDAIELTRKLEIMAENNTEEGLSATFTELNSVINLLMKEFLNYKQKISG